MIPNELLIGDHNAHLFISPQVVDGEVKGRGCIPRDYGIHPRMASAHEVAFDMPVIARSEWADRCKQLDATSSKLSDLRGSIPSRDQNGKGYCHTEDTEVLTDHGWITWPEYDWETPIATVNPTTHAMEFQRPFERHVYEYDGPMIYSTNRRIDFGVTPDHQMYVRKWDERCRTLSHHYSFVRAADMGWYLGLLHAPSGQVGTELVELEVPGDRRYDGDDFLALLGLIVSDGYAGGAEGSRPGKGTRSWVSFASFREESRAVVAALAARTGFHESPSRRGVWVRYDAGALAHWLRENAYERGRTGARAKRIPLLVKCASKRQIQHFLTWFDDRNRAGTQFYSTSKGLIDDLQDLHLRIGKRSSISQRPAKTVAFTGNARGEIRSGEGYVLTVGEVDRLCIERKKHIETDRYKGLVYCAAVPNHTLITRRNGSVLISSNCWAHSSVSASLLIRARDNQPYADLSAFAVACIIKGYQDEGGWGAQSLDWIIANGVPTAQYWPQQSMSRSNDTPAMRTNAALHKISETWMDVSAQEYDRTMTFDQVATCLLLRIPVVSDFNWWSHSVCAADLVNGQSEYGQFRSDSGKLLLGPEFDRAWGMTTDTGGFAIRIWNSWSDSWSARGMGVLSGSQAIPDGACAPRVATASDV
jgi:hypothetical protein